MSASWPAASVTRDWTVTLLTLPDATAWALAEQIIASRQPLPTAPGFEKPIVYFAPAAPPLGALDAPVLEQAAAINAMAARPIANRERLDPLIIRSPPRPWARRADVVTSTGRPSPVGRSIVMRRSGSPPARDPFVITSSRLMARAIRRACSR